LSLRKRRGGIKKRGVRRAYGRQLPPPDRRTGKTPKEKRQVQWLPRRVWPEGRNATAPTATARRAWHHMPLLSLPAAPTRSDLVQERVFLQRAAAREATRGERDRRNSRLPAAKGHPECNRPLPLSTWTHPAYGCLLLCIRPIKSVHKTGQVLKDRSCSKLKNNFLSLDPIPIAHEGAACARPRPIIILC
jgi:hypothetical protein